MARASIEDVKNSLLSRSRALGNSSRGLKEIASDLINQHGTEGHSLKRLCDGTFLCPSTIHRLAELSETEQGDPYRPQCDTIERVFKYFGAEIQFQQVQIERRYQNKPKREEK